MTLSTETEMPRIGLIGLGLMGKPMTRNLLCAEYSITVHDRSRAAVKELAGEGARHRARQDALRRALRRASEALETVRGQGPGA